MLSDYKPIVFNTPREFEEIEIYFAHDLHHGSAQHDNKRWERFKRMIREKPNRYIIFVGDYCENAVAGSKSDIYTQTVPPWAQKEWLSEQFIELADRTMCIVPGNHENNRITRTCGLFPVYDCAKDAGLQDLYRQGFAFIDIGVGDGGHGAGKQARYVGFVTHRLRDCKSYNGAIYVDGIDFAAYGHDHAPKSQPRGKLEYDSKNKAVVHRDIEIIDSGSFMTYGGYAVDNAYVPQSYKLFCLALGGGRGKYTSSRSYSV